MAVFNIIKNLHKKFTWRLNIMKKEHNIKIFILLFFVSVILSFGTVSAAYNTVNGSNFDDIQNTIDSSNSGDTILLGNKTYYSNTNSNINLNSNNIIIKGQSSSSKAILDGSGSQTQIMVIRGNNVRLENLIFRNAKTNIFGGAISTSSANLNIVNCDFINNNALNGGAIYSTANLNIVGATFTNNRAINGGAIYSSSGLTIDKSTFFNNHASSNGGGIYTSSKTSIKGNSKFNSNSAHKGAAIFSKKNSLTIAKTVKFNKNKASIGLSTSLVNKVVQYGKTKLKVKVNGYNNNIKIGEDVPIWADNYKSVKINGKTAKKYVVKPGTKFKLYVNGKAINTKFKSKTGSYVDINTYPTYEWKDFMFTATFNGGGIFNKSTTKFKFSARIANTDVYNMDKNKKSKRYYPYRKDKLQIKLSNGKIITKTIGQYASDNAYLLGAEKVPSNLRKFLWGYSGVADVNQSSISKQTLKILVSSSLKSKSSGAKGLLTPEKKLRAIQSWVGDNCVYLYEVPGGLIPPAGGAEVLKRINNKSIKNDTNCVGFSNLFVSLARTAGLPVSYINIPGHMIVAAYSIKNGKWYGVIIEPQTSSGNVYPNQDNFYQKGPMDIVWDSNGNKIIYYGIESVFGGDRTLDGVNYYSGLPIPLWDYQRLLDYSNYYNFAYNPNNVYKYVLCDVLYVY